MSLSPVDGPPARPPDQALVMPRVNSDAPLRLQRVAALFLPIGQRLL